jgi:hypothetical protein
MCNWLVSNLYMRQGGSRARSRGISSSQLSGCSRPYPIPPSSRGLPLSDDFTRDDFQLTRTSNRVKGVHCALSMLCQDLISQDAQKHPKSKMSLLKLVPFAMVNTYTSPKLSLGAGPLNDRLTVA